MSKRHNKSEGVGLPDWADDVTPADEVMRKFYAPTGTFKRGPIAIPVPPEPSAEPPAETADKSQTTQTEELRPTVEDSQGTQAGEISTSPDISTADADSPAVDAKDVAEVTADTAPAPATVRRVAAPRVRRRTVANLSSVSPPTSAAFEEFSRRWRRYLYPGQMSVMRVLFVKTVEAGESECFTRYSELAVETKMTRRNCINVINSLAEQGFVERVEVLNESRSKGIRLKVHTEPRG